MYSRARALGLAIIHTASAFRITDANVPCTRLLRPLLAQLLPPPPFFGLTDFQLVCPVAPASASGALTSCLEFPSHLAEPMVWQSYNAFPNTLYRLGLSAFSFPLSGKISPLMIPTVCIQPPAAEPICTKSHKQSKSVSLQMHKS